MWKTQQSKNGYNPFKKYIIWIKILFQITDVKLREVDRKS